MTELLKLMRLLNASFLVIVITGFQSGCMTVHYIDTFSEDSANPEDHRPGYSRFDEDPEPAGSYTLNDGQLIIKAKDGQNLWMESYKRGAPLLLRSAPSGKYEIETYVVATAYGASTPHPDQPADTQVGLFIFQDVCNWIFFGLTNHPSYPDLTSADGSIVPTDGLIVTATVGPSSGREDRACTSSWIVDAISFNVDAVYLRAKRQGDSWQFYWRSHPDQTWNLLTNLDKFHLDDHKVGMGVKSFEEPVLTKGQGMFDYFVVREKRFLR